MFGQRAPGGEQSALQNDNAPREGGALRERRLVWCRSGGLVRLAEQGIDIVSGQPDVLQGHPPGLGVAYDAR